MAILVQEKLGRLSDFERQNRSIDQLQLEWYETGKRILHKQTQAGKSITLKFLKEAPNLQQDDVLYEDEKAIIAVSILPCEVIIIEPSSAYELAAVCYEIGNKHLPLYYQEGMLLVPFDAPTFKLLQAAGFIVKKEMQKLLLPLKTSVTPHAHHNTESLFSRIMKLTNSTDAYQPA